MTRIHTHDIIHLLYNTQQLTGWVGGARTDMPHEKRHAANIETHQHHFQVATVAVQRLHREYIEDGMYASLKSVI